MYTRSRSSGGGPGFGNGRNQMNPGNANSFAAPSPYNPQGGNYTQSAYKSGLIEPSAPFKPSGSPAQQLQQGLKPRMQQPQQHQQQQQQHQQQQQQQQQMQQPIQTPTTPRLKPILKQSNLGSVAGGGAGNAQQVSTPSPVPPPNNAAAVAGATANKLPIGKTNPVAPPPKSVETIVNQSPAKNNSEPIPETPMQQIKNDEDARWTEDDQGKWGDNDDQSAWMDTEDGQQDRPKWRRFKKIPGNKPNKKLKRLRMNQRLRKAVMPKNAIMVLNEMKAGVQFTFPETQAIMPNSLFLVHAELDGKIYVGQGLSKPLARQNAAENALKSLLLEKMTAAAMKERLDADGDSVMDTTTTATTTTSSTANSLTDDTAQGVANSEENGDDATEENDDVPWSSLASFALYKLFLEWQNQGTVVPIPRPGVPGPTKSRPEPKPVAEKQLPPNAVEIHPVMLLNQMRPGTTYTEMARVGTPPNIQFTLGVDISGATYTGTAKNKKDAKKVAAKEALKALYNLNYPEEIKIDGADGSQ